MDMHALFFLYTVCIKVNLVIFNFSIVYRLVVKQNMDCTTKCKRNEVILVEWQKLNFISQAEGLFQVLNYVKLNIEKQKSHKRCFLMHLYKPLLCNDYYGKNLIIEKLVFPKAVVCRDPATDNIHQQTHPAEKIPTLQNPNDNGKKYNITEKATEFCLEHSFDVSSCKLYVSNIPFETKQKELWEFFEYFGKVLRVSIIKDKKTKKSRGYDYQRFSLTH